MTDESKYSIWLLNCWNRNVLAGLEKSASFDNSPQYAPYQAGSGSLLSEYDAVVWNQLAPIVSNGERDSQLLTFLRSHSGVFVFFLNEYKEDPSGDPFFSTLGMVFTLLMECDSTFHLGIRERQGRKFSLTPEGQISPFREYLETRQRWLLSFEQRSWLQALAVNNEKEAVAFSFKRFFTLAYFLPPPQDDEHMRIFYLNLLEAIGRSTDRTEPAPTRTNSFSLPGMVDVQKDLDGISSEIARLREQSSTRQAKLNRLVWIRNTLLSGDGKNLEKAVEEVLNEIGYDLKPGPAGREDFTFKHNGKHFLIEVKGATSSASEGHIKQLHAKQTLYVQRHIVEVKGVLIINPWRQYEPHERENKERVIFPEPMMHLVKIWHFCLIASMQLLAIYKSHLEGHLDRDKFAEEIYSTVGPLQGYDLKK